MPAARPRPSSLSWMNLESEGLTRARDLASPETIPEIAAPDGP